MILINEQLPTTITNYVETIDEAIEIIKKLEAELKNTAIAGIGLSANQIGIDKAVAIVRIYNQYDPTNPYSINLINPILIEANGIMEYDEGCLSFPGQHCNTIRYKEIIIETNDDYDYSAEHMNAKRYNREYKNIDLIKQNRRKVFIGTTYENTEADQLSQLFSVCIQHEAAHLLGLSMFDFKPQEVSRNDRCPCNSGKKNKKCHNYNYYNNNLNRLFNPNYRGA